MTKEKINMTENIRSPRHCGLAIIPSIRGRLSRTDYLLSFMFWSSLTLLCFIIDLAVFATPFNFAMSLEKFIAHPLATLTFVACAVLFIVSFTHVITTTVRRLHDINLSAWWMAPFFVPFILESWLFIAFTLPAMFVCPIASLLGESCTDLVNIKISNPEWIVGAVVYALVGFWWLFIFSIPGTPAANRFGEVTPISSKRVWLIVLRVGAMLIVAAIPFLVILFTLIILSGFRGWHC